MTARWLWNLIGAVCVFGCVGWRSQASAQSCSPRTKVDTSNQACGVAPRFDASLDLHLGAGLGSPCLTVGDQQACMGPAFPVLGAQLVAEFRPWRHLALGPVLAYDFQVGDETSDVSGEPTRYRASLWRLMLELRWYSRAVAQGGLFLAFRAGYAWLKSSVEPRSSEATSATQTAPIFGVGLGGAFVPYEGAGATLALHAFLAPFSSEEPELENGEGEGYAYDTMIFVGMTVGLTIGAGL